MKNGNSLEERIETGSAYGPGKKDKAEKKPKANKGADKDAAPDPEELTPGEMKNATGGENPFAGTPRVPVSPIDDDLRKNG